jgi:hypothetical protein
MGGDEITGEALNGAIFMMLGSLASMMLLIGGVAFSFWRRAQSLPQDGAYFGEPTLEKH